MAKMQNQDNTVIAKATKVTVVSTTSSTDSSTGYTTTITTYSDGSRLTVVKDASGNTISSSSEDNYLKSQKSTTDSETGYTTTTYTYSDGTKLRNTYNSEGTLIKSQTLNKKGKVTSTTNYDSDSDAVYIISAVTSALNFTSSNASVTDEDYAQFYEYDIGTIYGLPYQFLNTTDQRVSLDGSLSRNGRKFTEKVLARMPLLILAPGKQTYMKGASKNDANTLLSALINTAQDISTDDISSLIEKGGKYYSFEYDFSEYYNYVNAMCWGVAKFMGIQDKKVKLGSLKNRTAIGSIYWGNTKSDAFETFYSNKENIVFYLDGISSVSESYGNSTMESSLASTMNGFRDTVKEISFLFGDGESVVNNILETVSTGAANLVGSMTDLFDGDGVASSLITKGITTVASGGRIIFPEIWSDFQYERSYNLDIKLRTPDHDPVSIYLNIFVPYIHLLALCLPRSVDDDPNGYTSPFLVKAFCKGIFNIDMGIITSMSVTKGAEMCWNDDGLPTQIDISLDIKDLYSCLFMTSSLDASAVVNNTSLMDFMANMAGLNLAQDEIGRRWSMWNYLVKNDFTTTPSRLWTRFDQFISNKLNDLYNLI